ncbi:30S ribosomal protein S16 [Candidatus Peregrinibacteria bacterium]|nr:30S ribosomal protein S16 [Candidatus Peregrinibacteria bacterium]
MMLRIRLQRTGNKNNPTYRIVVADKRNAAKGKFNEIIGHYLPTREPTVFECDTERAAHWMALGAVPTDTMARLLSNSGVKGLEKYIERYAKQKKKNPSEEEIAAAAPAPEPAPEAPAEAPAEEVKEEAPAPEEKPAEEAPKEDAKEEDDKKEGDA